MAKNKKQSNAHLLSPENYIRQKARNLPIYECWLNSDWKKMCTAEIMIARIHTNGNITWAIYMVDLLSLGVRETVYRFNTTKEDYEDTRSQFIGHVKNITKADYVLVHNILYAASEYASGLGLQQHKDFTSVTRYLLEEDNDDIELMEIECGKNGRPMYVQTNDIPNTEVQRVINKLEKAVGKGNFDIILIEDGEGTDIDEPDLDGDDSIEKWDDEYSMMGFEEKRALFLEMSIKRFDKLTTEQQTKLIILTNNICLLDVCDYDIVNNLTVKWKAEKEIEITDNDYTTDSLGIESDQIITEADIDEFMEVDILIQKSPRKAEKLLKGLLKKWGNIPYLCYLELRYLEVKKSKAYGSKLKEYIALYPDYSLLKLEVYKQEIFNSEDIETIDILDFNETFRDRSTITDNEMFEFLTVKFIVLIARKDLNELEAQNLIIDDLRLRQEFLEFIGSTIVLTKINLLKEYLENFAPKNP